MFRVRAGVLKTAPLTLKWFDTFLHLTKEDEEEFEHTYAVAVCKLCSSASHVNAACMSKNNMESAHACTLLQFYMIAF